MKTLLTTLLVTALAAFATGAIAHEVRPGYLRIQEIDAETYDVLFRVPARGELRMALYVGLPEHCRNRGEVRAWQQNAAFMERWVAICPGGLVGHEVTIDGLAYTLTDVLVTSAGVVPSLLD